MTIRITNITGLKPPFVPYLYDIPLLCEARLAAPF